jgi:hypothetical protein
LRPHELPVPAADLTGTGHRLVMDLAASYLTSSAIEFGEQR